MQEANPKERLLGILKAALSVDAFIRGFILNGLDSKYASSSTVSRTTLEAVGLRPVIPKPDVPDPPIVHQGPSKPPTKKVPGKTTQAPPPPSPIQAEAVPDEWEGDGRVFVLALEKGPPEILVEQDPDLNHGVDHSRTRRSTPQGTQRRPTLGNGGSNITRRSKQSFASSPVQGALPRPSSQEAACASKSTCSQAEGVQGANASVPPEPISSDVPIEAQDAMKKGNADSCTEEQPTETSGGPNESTAEKEWESHMQSIEELKRTVFGKPVPSNCVVVRDAPCNALSTENHLMQQVRACHAS